MICGIVLHEQPSWALWVSTLEIQDQPVGPALYTPLGSLAARQGQRHRSNLSSRPSAWPPEQALRPKHVIDGPDHKGPNMKIYDLIWKYRS